MTKFEQIGINIQHSAITKEDAIRKFNHSCNLCCCKGMRINCDQCAISAVHNQLIAIFENKELAKHSKESTHA